MDLAPSCADDLHSRFGYGGGTIVPPAAAAQRNDRQPGRLSVAGGLAATMSGYFLAAA
jgi:hypothetical protein